MPMKRITAAVVFSAAFSALCASRALAADQTWSGTVSDSMCGLKHTMSEHGKNMADRECTQMCASHGAQYVLVVDGKVYKLRNHDADLKIHAGHLVSLTGDLESDRDTIRVSKIEMPKTDES
jgi:hypothetical protein